MSFKNKWLFFLCGAVLLAASCSKKPDVEYTDTYKMAGEWYTQYFVDGDALTDHSIISTYNTAETGSGKIWVQDDFVGHFKARMDVDYGNLAFKAMESTPNTETAGETLKVYEGKVLPGAGRSRTGVTVDSIYLRVEFSSEPGTVYEIRGHHRTGFFEDEY